MSRRSSNGKKGSRENRLESHKMTKCKWLLLCVSVCICVYLCVSVCICMYLYVCMHLSIYLSMDVCMYACTCMAHACMHVQISITYISFNTFVDKHFQSFGMGLETASNHLQLDRKRRSNYHLPT